jgi:hypothetical protein
MATGGGATSWAGATWAEGLLLRGEPRRTRRRDTRLLLCLFHPAISKAFIKLVVQFADPQVNNVTERQPLPMRLFITSVITQKTEVLCRVLPYFSARFSRR